MRACDIAGLRQFFMGALGWTPQTVMMTASLEDLQDAFAGYCLKHGTRTQVRALPSAAFLHEMAGKFPDTPHLKGRQDELQR